MMTGIPGSILANARKINNWEDDATGGTLWATTTSFKVVCPADKRWILIGGIINRDANAAAYAYIKDSSDNPIIRLSSYTAATGITQLLDYDSVSTPTAAPFIIDAGEYVEIVFDAAQGAGAYASCVVLEIDG